MAEWKSQVRDNRQRDLRSLGQRIQAAADAAADSAQSHVVSGGPQS